MTEWLYIAVGGACGAMARHATNLLAARWLGESLPYGTLAVNVVGCFCIGVIAQCLAEADGSLMKGQEPPAWRSLVQHGLSVGFLGGLTTFSAFGLQTVKLAEQQQFLAASGNVLLNLALGLTAVWLGAVVVRTIS
jgi:CrcB protein